MSLKELLGLKTLVKGPSPFKLALGDDFLYGRRRYGGKLTYEDLLNAESEIGRTIFGPIPAGHQREFFKNKENVWIWYEKWTDSAGTPQDITIRYEVRPDGVFKKVPEQNYQKITGDELNNFVSATRAYYNLVKERLYS